MPQGANLLCYFLIFSFENKVNMLNQKQLAVFYAHLIEMLSLFSRKYMDTWAARAWSISLTRNKHSGTKTCRSSSSIKTVAR